MGAQPPAGRLKPCPFVLNVICSPHPLSLKKNMLAGFFVLAGLADTPPADTPTLFRDIFPVVPVVAPERLTLARGKLILFLDLFTRL